MASSWRELLSSPMFPAYHITTVNGFGVIIELLKDYYLPPQITSILKNHSRQRTPSPSYLRNSTTTPVHLNAKHNSHYHSQPPLHLPPIPPSLASPLITTPTVHNPNITTRNPIITFTSTRTHTHIHTNKKIDIEKFEKRIQGKISHRLQLSNFLEKKVEGRNENTKKQAMTKHVAYVYIYVYRLMQQLSISSFPPHLRTKPRAQKWK